VRIDPNFLAYRTVAYSTVPEKTVYRSKKYRIIKIDLVLKSQFGVIRTVPKMHIFPVFNTVTLKERKA
jgi:hypothetical protein